MLLRLSAGSGLMAALLTVSLTLPQAGPGGRGSMQAASPDEVVPGVGDSAPEARLAAAEWAEAHGHIAEAEDIYRQILVEDPEHEPSWRRLHALAHGRPLPSDSGSYEEAKRLLPPTFIEYETKRFLVLSDASPRWTRAQMARLERAHHQFVRFCDRLDLRPLPLRHKLVCILFDSRERYAGFARQHDRMDNPWILGYYAPRGDRIVFYDGEKIDPTDPYATNRSIATTIHEAVHQLMFHTRVQNPRVLYPVWLSEGIATAFETDTPGAAFGPQQEYAPRRERFVRLLTAGELERLSDLLGREEIEGLDINQLLAMYNQSYALFTWLVRHRRHELRDYLFRLRREKGRLGAAGQRAIFESAFGRVDRMDAIWTRDERLRTAMDAVEREGLEGVLPPEWLLAGVANEVFP